MRYFFQHNNLIHPDALRHIPFVSLIGASTPTHDLGRLGAFFGLDHLFVKREDATDPHTYGGNKVRNLEFVLGEALACRATSVVTLVPTGSNFTAALAAQAQKVGLGVRLTQFTAQRNPQIDAHEAFARSRGAVVSNIPTMAGASIAAVQAALFGLSRHIYTIAPGASSALGAIGHLHAFLEMCDQVRRGEIPMPEVIIVGAGTCGTTAGLIAGISLLDLPIRLIAVRAAAPLVCNKRKILRLATSALRLLGNQAPVRMDRLQLIDPPGHHGYAKPLTDSFAQETRDAALDLAHLTLDSTYTTKVVTTLHHLARNTPIRRQRILYWHTFSPAAMSAPYLTASVPHQLSPTEPLYAAVTNIVHS